VTAPTITRTVTASVILGKDTTASITISTRSDDAFAPFCFMVFDASRTKGHVTQFARADLLTLSALIDRALVVGAALIDQPTTSD
jgi:hypothetical protein